MIALLLVGCAPSSPAPSTEPTYYRDVRPILDETCAHCHTDAGIATSFDDPAAVVALATSIQARTQAGTMPPPAPDPSCADYVGSDSLFLSDADKATLSDWVDAGAPLGDV